MSLKSFVGTWHIYEMEQWDEDYFNMEVQAFIEIKSDYSGNFQFGLVSGYLDGDLEQIADKQRFNFTWEGNDEMDDAQGRGWLEITFNNELKGMIKFHQGDQSGFKAKKVS